MRALINVVLLLAIAAVGCYIAVFDEYFSREVEVRQQISVKLIGSDADVAGVNTISYFQYDAFHLLESCRYLLLLSRNHIVYMIMSASSGGGGNSISCVEGPELMGASTQ